ncbi:response regulator transcription factor [Paenibacillus contaminans]|nr:response regulator [Paenibacillus contaminans]
MQKLKVLIVDDEQLIRERFSVRIPWDKAGFQLIGAAVNGRQAIEMMEQELPDLLLTDITMPVMDGLALAEYVRGRWPKVRVVFLTAYSEFAYAQKAIMLGAKGYLLKATQSSEQILETCRTIAEDISRELEAEEKLTIHEKRRSEEEWEVKRQLMEDVIAGDALNGTTDDQIAANTLQQQILTVSGGPGSNFALFSLGWDWHEAAQNKRITAAEMNKQQREAGREIEKLLAGGGGEKEPFGFCVYPYRTNRLLVLLHAPYSYGVSSFQAKLHFWSSRCLGVLKEIVQAGCFLFADSIVASPELTLPMFRSSQEKLAAYFYKQTAFVTANDTIVYQDWSLLYQAELVALAARAFHGGNVEDLKKAATELTTMRQPPFSPLKLKHAARTIMETGPWTDSGRKHSLLSKLQWLETWSDYCDWWREAILQLESSGIVREHMTVRKEVQQMCRIIHEQYDRDLLITDLAAAVEMNAAYAGQLFKQETGEYVTDYLNRVRMKKAKELLDQTDMKVYEVSHAVGISGYRYFCKLFKEIIGSTPTDYKNKSR